MLSVGCRWRLSLDGPAIDRQHTIAAVSLLPGSLRGGLKMRRGLSDPVAVSERQHKLHQQRKKREPDAELYVRSDPHHVETPLASRGPIPHLWRCYNRTSPERSTDVNGDGSRGANPSAGCDHCATEEAQRPMGADLRPLPLLHRRPALHEGSHRLRPGWLAPGGLGPVVRPADQQLSGLR